MEARARLHELIPSPPALHHAYLITGMSKDRARQEFEEFTHTRCGMPFKGNPDVLFFEFIALGISDSRMLYGRAIVKPIQYHQKLIGIFFESMTLEAQNALLKLFEHPPLGTHFFLFGSEDELIPTLSSRLYSLRVREARVDASDTAHDFLQSSVSKRMELVETLCRSLKNESKSKREVGIFLETLERLMYEKNKTQLPVKTLFEIQKIRSYLFDRGASVKMLLEYLALTLPRVH